MPHYAYAVNILITGGTGFLGKKTLENLLANPRMNIHLVHRNQSNLEFLCFTERKRINFINVSDLVSIEVLMRDEGIETILHMATNYDRNGSRITEVVEANLTLPLQLLIAGTNSGVKHFINVDSFYTKTEFEYKQLFNYTQSKRALIPWLQHYSEEILVSNLILEHMYGPGDRDDKLIPSLIRSAGAEWSDNVVKTGGEQIRDFIFVDDVVSALECVIDTQSNLQVGFREYEVGTGVGTNLIDLTSLISKLVRCPNAPNFKQGVYPANEIMRSVAQNKSLVSLGWAPKFGLREGMSKTINGE
jgi:nucleoside-diphosphate-sugar epimerase